MTWANFYLTCFLLGFSLSLASFLLGALNLHGLHLFHGHAAPHAGHGHATHSAGGSGGAAGASVSPFNFATITAFLAWFGGAGYLLTRYGGWWAMPALALAMVTRLAGAVLMFAFMVKVVWSPHENLDPDDYDLIGLIGVVSSSIREGGTGEILFPQAGARRTAGGGGGGGGGSGGGGGGVVTQQK